MTDLDPTMLAKFEQFQAMLAETPEIVEALNSPELLALAALAAEKKNANATPEAEADTEPEPEPNYPMVGYGHSDDVSVMSEMSIPTVVTKQTVEEDEFYPEIDATGVSTSGLGATRRIGMRIGANAGSFETTNGTLPPPPPKHNNLSSLSNSNSNSNSNSSRRTSSSRRGRGNILNKPKIRMSKISEHDGSASASVTSESTEPELRKRRPPLTAKKGNWKPNRSAFGSTTTTTAARDDEPFPVELEKHPFNNNKGSTTTTTTSSSSTTVPTKNKSDANGRGGLRKRNSTHGRKGPDSADDAGANPNRRGEGVATDGFAVTVGERQSLSPVPTRQLSESKLSLTRIPRRSNELLRKTSLSNGSIGSASASGGSGSSSRDGRPRSAPKMRLVPVTKTPTPKTTTTLTRSGSDQGRSHTRSHSRGRGGKTNTTRPRSRSRVRTRAPARDQEQEHEQKHEQKHEISNPIVAAALQKNFHNDDSADTDNQNQNNSHSHKHEPKLSDSNRRSPKRWTRPSNDDPSSVPSAFRAPSRRQPGTGGHSQKSRDSTHGTKSSRGSTSTATSLFSTKSKSKRILGNSNGNGNSNSSKVASEEQRMVSITASPSQSQVQSQSQSDSSDPVTSQSDTKSRTYSSSNPRKSLVAPNRKSSSNRTRSEEPTKSVSPTTTPGSDDDEDDYVPRKVRKPARSKSSSSTDKQTTKTSRSSNGNDNSNGNSNSNSNSNSNRNRSSSSDDEIYVPDPEIFKKMIYGDLSHQNHASRPDEFVHSAGTGTSTNTNTSTSTSTRIKKERPKPTYGNNKVNSNRADEWLGSGTTQKRTWRVKGSSN